MLHVAPWNLADDSFNIVGIVKDTVNQVGEKESLPEMYVPFTVLNRADRIFALGNGRAETLDRAVKAQIYAADPGQAVTDDKSMEPILRENAYPRPRFNLLLFPIFPPLALLLPLS